MKQSNGLIMRVCRVKIDTLSLFLPIGILIRAHRIEVWHKDASTLKETKLLEKVYRVDGWMR